MHIDPFTIVVFNIMASFLMSSGLFSISTSYFGNVKAITHRWATALLFQFSSWILLALTDFIPKFLSVVVGVACLFLGLVFYFQGLAALKKCAESETRWLYLATVFGILGNIYFIYIDVDMASKIAVTSATMTVLMCANTVLLFSKQDGVRPNASKLSLTY